MRLLQGGGVGEGALPRSLSPVRSRRAGPSAASVSNVRSAVGHRHLVSMCEVQEMIRKDKSGEFVASCDEEGCRAKAYGGVEDDFRRFVEQIKDEGWTVSRTSAGEYEHRCESCGEE